MRKIESNMNAAIKSNANWKNANTQVTTEGTLSKVYLHGNLIAKVGDDFVTVSYTHLTLPTILRV